VSKGLVSAQKTALGWGLSRPVQVALVVIPVLALVLSLFVGRYPARPEEVVRLLAAEALNLDRLSFPEALRVAILQVRLPRVIMGILIGASLSVSGACFQGIFRNPLVSPDILGVTNGAAFGAALAILLGAPISVVQTAAFASGLLSVGLTYGLSRFYRTTPTLTLVLAGVIVGAFFSALVSFLKYTADPLEKMPAIVFWLMGSLAKASPGDLGFAGPLMIGAVIALLLVRWRVNVLSMGDEDAKALGMDVERHRLVIICFCTLATSAAVSVAGVIGWVGLVIPHIGRMLVGPDHKLLLPASASLGGAYLLLMDNLARSVTTAEVPLGIFTALVGAPFFAYLLRRGSGWS